MSTHQQTYAKIKEANEICQTMGMKIKFTPCLVRTEEKKKEVLKVQVERFDNQKSSVLLEADQFEDRLIGIRDQLAEFQN